MASSEVRVMEKIPRSSLICGRPLGQGGFGNVINGTYNGKDVAVKILHSPVRAESYREFNFMFQLKHKNLTRMLGIVDLGYSECPQLVFLKATRGNLLQYVEGIEDDVLEPLKKGMLNKLATDVINGMEYLHQMHYFHKTLAARNIVIHQFKDYLNAQISDYGISLVIDGQGANYYKTEEGVTLPIRWIPKECIPSGNSTGAFQFASDVWSFGVVLWEAWTKGDIPYGAARSNTEVRQLILNGSSPLTFFRPQCPADVMAVIESIFREKPEERPTFTDLGKAFNRMKPQQSNDKKTLSGGKNEEGNTNRPHEKGPKNQQNPHQGGEKNKHDGGANKGQRNQNQQPGGQNFPNQRPPNMQNPNQRPPSVQNPNQRPPNMQNPNQRPPNRQDPNQRPPNMQNPNQRPQNMQNPNQRTQNMQNPNQRPPNMQNPNQRPPNMQNPNQRPQNMPNQGQPGSNKKGQNRGQQQQGPQVSMDAPPPYSPPIHDQPPPMMNFAGAAPPAFQPPPPPPPYSSGGKSEADLQKQVMDLQQKISSLEVKQLEQKLQSLQKEVEGGKSQNKPKNPNHQHKRNPNQNRNPNQQQKPHSNPNNPPEFVPYGATPQYPNFQGNQNANQGHSSPSNIPDWMPAAGSAIFGMAAGAAMAAAAMNNSEKKKKK